VEEGRNGKFCVEMTGDRAEVDRATPRPGYEPTPLKVRIGDDAAGSDA
jgi:hypothetical protein